jgi:hypothetical protein
VGLGPRDFCDPKKKRSARFPIGKDFNSLAQDFAPQEALIKWAIMCTRASAAEGATSSKDSLRIQVPPPCSFETMTTDRKSTPLIIGRLEVLKSNYFNS